MSQKRAKRCKQRVPRLFRNCPASVGKAYESVLRGSNPVAALSEGLASSAAGAPRAVALAAGPPAPGSKKRQAPAATERPTGRGVDSKRRAVAPPPHNPPASVSRSQSQAAQPVTATAAASPRFNDDSGKQHDASARSSIRPHVCICLVSDILRSTALPAKPTPVLPRA